MERNEVSELVFGLLRDMGCGDVRLVHRFIEDLGMDSLDILEFIMDVENKLCIYIPDDTAGEFTTVDNFVNYVYENSP